MVSTGTYSLGAADSGDEYRVAYRLLQKADADRDGGFVDEAIAGYTHAKDAYEALVKRNPAFEKDLVTFRITYCGEQIDALSHGAVAAENKDVTPYAPATNVQPDTASMLKEARDNSIHGTPERAVGLLAGAMRNAPSNDTARLMMGIVQLQLGHSDDAASLLGALANEPDPSVEVFLALGGVQLALGDWMDAKRSLDRALALEPKMPAIHYNMAQLYLQATPPDIEAASAAYLKSLALGGKRDPELEKRLKR